jgi:hypothetical protein
MWSQQDSETAHTAKASLEMSQEHVILLLGELRWPTCSLDLPVCDYFLWVYLKAKVYITPPRTIDEWKFERKFQRYQKTWENCGARLEVYVRYDEQHHNGVLFKMK